MPDDSSSAIRVAQDHSSVKNVTHKLPSSARGVTGLVQDCEMGDIRGQIQVCGEWDTLERQRVQGTHSQWWVQVVHR